MKFRGNGADQQCQGLEGPSKRCIPATEIEKHMETEISNKKSQKGNTGKKDTRTSNSFQYSSDWRRTSK